MGEERMTADVLRVFGSQLKLLREQTGRGRSEFGQLVGYAARTIEAYEQGRRIAPTEFVLKADETLGAGGVLAAAAKELQRSRLPVFLQEYAEYERAAVAISWYGNQVAPGLLQTKEYARALLSASRPVVTEETVEQRVAARLERQALVDRRPAVELSFIIGEAPLRTPIGGTRVLKEQLKRLVEYAELPNVEIQVMPFSRGAHPGLDGPLLLLETEDASTFGYRESQGAGTIVADPQEVSILAQRYGILRSRALGTEESVRFIEQVTGEL